MNNIKTLNQVKNEEITTKAEEIQKAEQVKTTEEIALEEINSLIDNIQVNQKVIKTNFAMRIIHCFTEDTRAKYNEEMKLIEEIKQRVKKLAFDYAIYDNKYFYIVNKTQDTEKSFYNAIIKIPHKNDNITITPKNIKTFKPVIDKFLSFMESKKAEEMKKETEEKTEEITEEKIEE